MELDEPEGERWEETEEEVVLEGLRLEMNDSVEVKSPRRCSRMRSSADNSSSVVVMIMEREREVMKVDVRKCGGGVYIKMGE